MNINKLFSVFILFFIFTVFFSLSALGQGNDSEKKICPVKTRLESIETKLDADYYKGSSLEQKFTHLNEMNKEFEKRLMLRLDNQNDKINFYIKLPAIGITVLGIFGVGWIIFFYNRVKKNWEQNIEDGKKKFADTNQKWEQKFSETKNEMQTLHDGIKTNELVTTANRLFGEKKYDDALEKFTKALEINPEDPKLWSGKGDCLALQEQYEKASEAYSKVLELYQQADGIEKYIYRVWNAMGFNLTKLKRYKEALNAYNKASELAPTDIGIYKNFLEIKIMNNEPLKIESINNKITSFNPKIKDLVVLRFLMAINQKINGQDTSVLDAEIEELLTQNIKLTWDFSDLADWAKNSELPASTIEYIEALSAKMKSSIK